MKYAEYIIIGISLALTVLISTLIGLAGYNIHGPFWSWFSISFLVQVIIFVGWNSYLIQKDYYKQQQIDVQALEQLSKFTVKLSCAYCKHNNNVPIQLNQRNTFKCDNCKQSNSVHMQFTAATLTTPIESVKIPLLEGDSVEFKVRD